MPAIYTSITGWVIIFTCYVNHSKCRKEAHFNTQWSQNPCTNLLETWCDLLRNNFDGGGALRVVWAHT